MNKEIKKAIFDVIQNAINEDFWSEDSLIIDAFQDTVGEPLDCDGLSVWQKEEFGETILRVDFNQSVGCSIIINR